MYKRLRTLVTLFVLCTAPIACMAITIDEAKSQGLVGERPDGYLGAVSSSPSGDVLSLVNGINSKRRSHYMAISTENRQPRSVVEALAGRKVRSLVKPGEYYMDDAGNWVQK